MNGSDVAKVLDDALNAVDASSVPEELREAAFVQAVQLLSRSLLTGLGGNGGGKSSGDVTGPATGAKGTSSAPSSPDASSGPNSATEDAPSADEFYDNLVRHTHVDREVLEDLLHYTSDKITINVTGRQLGTSLRQKQIAAGILLSVAYQYGLGHSTTSITVIREECTRLRAADHNLPTYLRSTDGIRLVGDSRIKNIQLRDAALDLFKTEAERIAGKSEGAE